MQLICHPASRCAIECRLTADARLLEDARLQFRYELVGNASHLRIPAKRTAARVDGLWAHTCFEAFVRAHDRPEYHEFNFSPSGEWACYRFRAYREPEADPALSVPGINVNQKRDHLVLEAVVNLSELGLDAGRLEIALSAVIEMEDGCLSYWALKHPSAKPDFHHPDSFALLLQCR